MKCESSFSKKSDEKTEKANIISNFKYKCSKRKILPVFLSKMYTEKTNRFASFLLTNENIVAIIEYGHNSGVCLKNIGEFLYV